VINQSIICKHAGHAVAPKVAKAKTPGYQMETYSGAGVPPPTMWRRAQLMFNSCCEETSQIRSEPEIAAIADLPEQPVVAHGQQGGADAYLRDPGPPQDAVPAHFLGPRPDFAKAQSEAGDAPAPSPSGYGYGYGGNVAGHGSGGYSGRGAGSGYGNERTGSVAPPPPPYAANGPRTDGDAGRNQQEEGMFIDVDPPPEEPTVGDSDPARPDSGARYPPGPDEAPSSMPAHSDGYGGGYFGGYGGAAPPPAPYVDSQRALARAAAQAKYFRDRYTLGKRLSSGTQGVTYLATSKYSGVQVVAKKPNNPQDINDYLLLSKKTHPNIVRVYELFQEELETFIVMEFAGGGDLFHAIEQLHVPTQNWTANVFRQVVWGVNYLHTFFNESHNDIKPENIFLDRKPSGPSDVPRAMIGDFGCLAAIGRARTGGDPRYRAPETFDIPAWNAATDMWALGVTLFEIASGGLTIYTNARNLSSWEKFRNSGQWEPLRMALLRAQPVNLGRIGSDSVPATMQLKELLKGLLDVHSGKRFTAQKALEMPWLKLDPLAAAVAFDQDCAATLSKRARRHVLDIALLNLIGNLLQGESIRHYQAIWDKYDLNADGSMNKGEFNLMIKDIAASNARLASMAGSAAVGGAEGRADINPCAQDLFTLADTNNSGRIEFNEFVGLMFDPDDLSADEYSEYLKSAFVSLARHDGRIGPDDLAGLFAKDSWTQAREATEVVQRLFHDMDTDEDGLVSFKEFSAYMDGLS